MAATASAAKTELRIKRIAVSRERPPIGSLATAPFKRNPPVGKIKSRNKRRSCAIQLGAAKKDALYAAEAAFCAALPPGGDSRPSKKESRAVRSNRYSALSA